MKKHTVIALFMTISLIISGCEGLFAPSSTEKTSSTVDTVPPSVPSGSPTVTSPASGSLKVLWAPAADGVTASGSLQYRITYAYLEYPQQYAGADRALIPGAIIEEPMPEPTEKVVEALAWTAASSLTAQESSLTYTITGLNASTAYRITVEVKDGAGNLGKYAETAETYPDGQGAAADVTPPVVPAAAPEVSSPAAGSLTVLWTPASDTVTAQGDLQYRVEYSYIYYPEVMAGAGRKLVGPGPELPPSGPQEIRTVSLDWTAGSGISLQGSSLSHTITGLVQSTPYTLRITVKDSAGNMAEYQASSPTTPTGPGEAAEETPGADTTAPAPGISSNFSPTYYLQPTYSPLTYTYFWSDATDAGSTAVNLSYRVLVKETAGETWSTLSDWKNSTLYTREGSNRMTFDHTGWTVGTSYTVRIEVKDEAGNTASYAEMAFTAQTIQMK